MSLNLYSIAFGAVGVLAEPITVLRRTDTNIVNGCQNIQTSVYNNIQATIVAASPDDMERNPDYEVSRRLIEVSANFPLQASRQGFQADIIVWHGDKYIVTSIKDYSKAGAGFVTALCKSIDTNDGPTMAS